MSFPRYPQYKDSGVEWLGEVPGHWDISALKRVAHLQSGESITSESIDTEGQYPVFGGNGLRGYTDSFTHEGHYALIGRQGALCGNINYAKGQFWASEHAVVATPVRTISTVWLGELMRSMDLNQYSVSAAQPGLSVEIVSNLRIPVPPLSEQNAIAAFLGHETAKIEGLMAEQEKLITLLKEKRQAVIAHAVTKGLVPRVPMKDSGVEWLGEVPAHWTVISLGRVTQEKCDGPFGSGLKSEHYTESGVRVIRLQNIRQDGFDGSDEAFIDANYYQSALAGRDVVAGDVLIAGLGDERNTVGRACVAPGDIAQAMVKADCFRFRLFTEIAVPAFVARQLSVSSSADAGAFATGTTRSRIPLTVMATRKVSLPPAKEQQEIISWIEQEMAKLDALCAECKQAIDLLKERRTALISAAVTGQIDVRGLVKDEQEQAA